MNAIAILGALLMLGASGSTGPAKPAPPPPPYEGVYQPRGVDEIGMWREADEDERALANSPILIRDEALNAYVRGVLCRTVGDDRCKAARIYILRTPVFNATMAPNGTMRVFSGLLLRVHNEAELGAILGHEFGHFERRHTLASFKAARSGTDLLSWAAVLSSMAGTYQARTNFSDLQLSVYGGFYHFNRDNEREADALGIGYLNASSLRPQAASTVWRNLIGEAEASASAKGLRRPRLDRVAFFSTHPPEAERAVTLALLAAPDAADRDDGAGRYTAAMARWLPLFLDDQIKLNDFGASDYIIDSLARSGWTAPLWLARGDLYRLRGNPRDLVNAADFYREALALDGASADATRGLGLVLIKLGQRSDGEKALRRYLELRPDATDAAMIGMLLTPSEAKP